MVGVNFPLPTPVGYYSHGGWKNSAFGDLNQYGEDSIRFFTRTKNVTQRWPQVPGVGGGDILSKRSTRFGATGRHGSSCRRPSRAVRMNSQAVA